MGTHHEHDHQHEHEHEHHHEHEHEHHHEHEHEHEHTQAPDTGIAISAHEGAQIGTVRCRIPGSYGLALDTLQERMEEEASDIEAAGGMIGHIKASAREESRCCMFSITECGDTQRKESVCPSVYVEHAAIVFGIGGDVLLDILTTRFGEFVE